MSVLLFQLLDIQALTNMVWSLATIMGEECSNNPAIHALFVSIR
jgi:hypothetical protein